MECHAARLQNNSIQGSNQKAARRTPHALRPSPESSRRHRPPPALRAIRWYCARRRNALLKTTTGSVRSEVSERHAGLHESNQKRGLPQGGNTKGELTCRKKH